MRFVSCLLLVLASCVHAGARFFPAHPEEAVAGQPEAASAESAGVRLTVHAGDWRGDPQDLEDRLTPVEVWVENGSGRTIRIGPEHFGLLGPNGFRYQALDARAVQAAFANASRGTVVYYGAYGAYPWPGFWGPYRPRVYPYFGYSPWYGPPPPAFVQAPAPPPPPPPRGTLASGGNVSMLLFFPVPAKGLGAMEVSLDLEDAAGGRLGVVQVALTQQPPAARPPTPEPTAPPPPPPPPPQK